MRAVAVICFFFSGASGLVFEVIWSRMFSLVFGATTLAISTVLTAFMGGLALGSFLSGRIADKVQDPLKLYAAAEAGIGLAALALPHVVAHYDGLNQLLYAHFGDSYPLLALMRFLASFALLLVPTTLMGATLPLLSRFFVQSEGEQARVGMRVGLLYAINTFGAVIGTGLGGFVLLPNLGLSTTNTVAASVNLVLAVVVLGAYRLRRYLPAPAPVDPELAALLQEVETLPTVRPNVPPRARSAALIAFALSGAVAMIYQQIWTRTLSMTIGSSIYSFTIVLVGFLIGLAGGAAVVGRLAARSRDPVGWLAVNHLVIVTLVGLTYLLTDQLPFIFLFFIRGTELGAGTVLSSQFLLALLVMLPATFAMGGVFPLTIRIYAGGLDTVGRDVGSVYSLNTLGSIVGSFLGGFVVIPALQLQPGTYAGVCINIALAVMLFWVSPWRLRPRLLGIGAALVLLAVGPLLPRWNISHVTSGLFRLSIARDVLQTGRWKDPKLVFHRDGIVTTVTVDQWSNKHFSMKNNGKVDASTGDDMPTQIAVGLLPVLLHPEVPELKPTVALVGYASGVTAGAVLQAPVKRLDVVELEPAILQASAFFEHVNNKPMDDKRLRLVTDDGRNFLAAGREPYDVIINEPSNPWITGVANLFTREYFEVGRRRLKPGGIFCTWAQMYEISPRHIKSIYRTFAEVFPYAYAFSAEALSSDTFLIGSNRPLRPDIRRLRRVFALPRVKKELRRAKIDRPDDLLALTLLAPGEIHPFTMGARVNTDDNALIEFGAPRDLFNHKQYDYYISRVYGQTWLYGHLGGFFRGYKSSEDHAGLVHSLLKNGKFREAYRLMDSGKVDEKAGPQSWRAARLMELLATHDVTEKEVDLAENGPPLAPPRLPRDERPEKEVERIAREFVDVLEHAQAKRYRKALDMVEAWPKIYREGVGVGHDFELFWGYLVYKCQDFHTAVKILEPIWEDEAYRKKRPALLYYVGRAFYGNADFAKAVKALEAWIDYRKAQNKRIAPPVKDANKSDGEQKPPSQLIPG